MAKSYSKDTSNAPYGTTSHIEFEVNKRKYTENSFNKFLNFVMNTIVF